MSINISNASKVYNADFGLVLEYSDIALAQTDMEITLTEEDYQEFAKPEINVGDTIAVKRDEETIQHIEVTRKSVKIEYLSKQVRQSKYAMFILKFKETK